MVRGQKLTNYINFKTFVNYKVKMIQFAEQLYEFKMSIKIIFTEKRYIEQYFTFVQCFVPIRRIIQNQFTIYKYSIMKTKLELHLHIHFIQIF